MSPFGKIIAIMIAGGLGAVSRYGLAQLVSNWTDRLFPWGTVVVNIAGCLVFGLLVAVMEDRPTIAAYRPILLIGFMGAFTTFSTYMYETQQLLERSEYFAAFGNLALQNLVGFAAILAGLALGRLV